MIDNKPAEYREGLATARPQEGSADRESVNPADPRDACAREAEAAGRMRILWVKVGGLWPINTGGRIRSFHIIDELSRHHEVSVLTTHQPEEDPQALRENLPHCKGVESIPFTPHKRDSTGFYLSLLRSWSSAMPVDVYKNRIKALREKVEAELDSGEYDLCIADFMVALPNVPMGGKVPVVFFSHNVEYMIWRRLCQNDGNVLRRPALSLEWRKMRRYETEACRRADLTVTVSEEDRVQLGASSTDSRIHAVPTGVDIDYFKPGPDRSVERPRELVFTGSMDWHPNDDAMLWFMEDILPLVQREFPDVTLSIVGRNPGRELCDKARESKVTVTGTVDDIRPYVDAAAVYVVPLRIGGGTRLKIYEALAMGKAVVSTSIGAEGLPLEEGRHIVRADEAEDFAARVVTLLREQESRDRLGTAGRRLMEENFAWPRVAEVFAGYCREALRS